MRVCEYPLLQVTSVKHPLLSHLSLYCVLVNGLLRRHLHVSFQKTPNDKEEGHVNVKTNILCIVLIVMLCVLELAFLGSS